MNNRIVSLLILALFLLFGCGKTVTPPPTSKPITIAVLYFDLVNPTDALSPLKKLLAHNFSDYLVKSPNIRLYEREKLNSVLGELKLQQSAMIDPETAVKVGKLAGVEALYYGGFMDFRDQIYVNGHLYRVETGEMLVTVGGDCPNDDRKKLDKLIASLADDTVNEINLLFDASMPKRRGAPEPERITMAVLPFSNDSETEGGHTGTAPTLLETGLIDLFVTELGKNKHLRLVERFRLEKILRELKLQQSAMMSPQRASQVGKLLGAQLVFYGGFADFMGQFDLSGKLTRVETAEIIDAEGAQCDSAQLEGKLSALVTEVAKKINTETEKKYNLLLADIYYSKGEDYETENNATKAKEMYQKALSFDKSHAPSLEALKRLGY